MTFHFAPAYFLHPQHPISIDLVGLGGTGSRVLSNLARLNHALIAMDHPGLSVRAWDDDVISSANIGRQLFSVSDIGLNKAVVLVTRINQFYGFDWMAHPSRYSSEYGSSNITITCVDTAAMRIKIGKQLRKVEPKKTKNGAHPSPVEKKMYWLDFGNSKKTGQVILGTLQLINQPDCDSPTKATLMTVDRKFPELKRIKEKDQGPSCSLAEALNKQDLFINSVLAEYGVNILWKLFREGKIAHHGVYVNLETMVSNPIAVKA